MIFAREVLTDQLLDEAMPLLQAHWKEIAHYQDIPLSPDRPMYLAAEATGLIRCFTVRRPTGLLIGYATFFVKAHPHFTTSLQAVQDILFMHPDWRGHGMKFLLWCDEQLQGEEVQVVYHSVNAQHDFGKMLIRAGYQLVDHVYLRRLD